MRSFRHFANFLSERIPRGRHAHLTSDQTMAASWPKSIQVSSSEIEEEPDHVPGVRYDDALLQQKPEINRHDGVEPHPLAPALPLAQPHHHAMSRGIDEPAVHLTI